jgi:pimeloyl-ACP methyl ester carboxylesterase
MNLINVIYTGSQKRKSLYDLFIPENFEGDLILFIHGYMGFKDWGAWNLMGESFKKLGFGFCKFNMTHNGGTVNQPIDFSDLEAFANNTYSKEVFDVDFILQEIKKVLPETPRIHLLGHSRGGGIGLLCAKNPLVSSVTTLAGIASIESRFSNLEMIQEWKKTGVRYVQNQRTKQNMPHNYVQYLDFIENKENLNIQNACQELTKPNLVIHGDGDTSVQISEGKLIATWTNSPLYEIQNADHTFGSVHPWSEENLPEPLQEVITIISTFIQKQKPQKTSDIQLGFADQIIQLSELNEETKVMDFEFLIQIAHQIGLTKSELIEQFENSIQLKPKQSEEERIIQFYRLCLLIFIHGEIEEKEIGDLINAGLRMGLHPDSTEHVIDFMQKNTLKTIEREKLIKIFKVNSN